ncbi:hypothetical protein H1Q59_05395 [Holosporaceae bacterium 'Namur']|nr:hypothetical protein [Holosporaceae bacterium 'Namur']
MLKYEHRDNFYAQEIKASVENKKEILAFLRNELPKENKESITTLAKRLRYFKPALTFAAIYVTSSKTSIEEFIAKYSIHERVYKECTDEIAYPLIYSMCSKVLIDFIEEKNRDAYEILYVGAYLGQNNIPDKLLISWFGSKFCIEESIAERRYYLALESLEDCKLVQKCNNNFSIIFFILQDQMKAICEIIEKRQEEFLKELSNVFCNTINVELNKDKKDLSYLEMLLPHINIISKYLNALIKKV